MKDSEDLTGKPSTDSVETPVKEPKRVPAPKEAAKPVSAKPAPRRKDSVVSGGSTDPIYYSKAKIPSRGEARNSLSVLHVQRALAFAGVAVGSPTGRYDSVTQSAVSAYQSSVGEEPTGVLTRKQFVALFEGDPNVEVIVDTHYDHT